MVGLATREIPWPSDDSGASSPDERAGFIPINETPSQPGEVVPWDDTEEAVDASGGKMDD